MGANVGSAGVGDFRATSIYAPVASGTGGVWRVEVDGWSAILKLVRHDAAATGNWQSGEAEDHWYYWRREVLAYQTGLLPSLPGEGLRAPHCYGAIERPDGPIALWLEDAGRTATGWPVARYGEAARHLGRMQGAFLVETPLPDHPWLSRHWLRTYVTPRRADLGLLDDPAAWPTGLVDRSLAPALRRMDVEQPQLLDELDRMPQTLCHFDVHPANLLDVDGKTVLIDWSFVGIGAIGEDAGNLVPDAVLDFHVPAAQVDELFEAVFRGYAAGLADAGWRGDPRLVRRAMKVAIAAKYSWIVPALLRAGLERRPTLNRRPFAETVTWWAPMAEFLASQLGRD
jgi:hypothetical protein